MVDLIVAFGGPIASGKTTLSRAIAERLGAERRSFSDVVKLAAAERGRNGVRLELQQTGEELIVEGWPEFVRRVLTPTPTGDALVVDGIRHLGAIDELVRQLPDARIILVFVEPPSGQVVARVVERLESPEVLLHHVETELPQVAARADVIVGGLDLETDMAAVLALFAN